MSILSDEAILSAIDLGELEIDPFNSDNLTPNGYDLTISEVEIPNDSKIDKSYFKLGFGTSQIGGASTFANKQVGMGKQRESDSIASIKFAKKSRINFFDTSDTYGDGRSEKFLS